MRRSLLSIAFVLAVLGLSACGGGDGTPVPAASTAKPSTAASTGAASSAGTTAGEPGTTAQAGTTTAPAASTKASAATTTADTGGATTAASPGATTGGADSQTASQVPANAVAVVAGTPILRSTLDRYVAQKRREYQAQKKSFPAPGSSAYRAVENQILVALVQRVDFATEAARFGIKVTEAEISSRIRDTVKQQFKGSEKAYASSLRRSGATVAEARDEVRAQLVYAKLGDRISRNVTVTDQEIRAEYEKQKASLQTKSSRKVAVILVRTKAEANDVEQKLRSGADFDKLAATASLSGGGTYTDTEGGFPPAFEQVAYGLATGQVSAPVQVGGLWYVIKALGPTSRGGVTPLAQVEKSIREQLESQKRGTVIQRWATAVEARYEKATTYAPGFGPVTGGSASTQ